MSLSTLFRFSSLTSLWHFDISLFICNIIHLSLWCSLFSCSVKTAAVSLLLGFNCFKNALISKRIISTYRQRTLRVHFIPDRRKERKEERKWEQIVISKCLNFKRDYLTQTGREDWEFISYPILTGISRLNFDRDRRTNAFVELMGQRPTVKNLELVIQYFTNHAASAWYNFKIYNCILKSCLNMQCRVIRKKYSIV